MFLIPLYYFLITLLTILIKFFSFIIITFYRLSLLSFIKYKAKLFYLLKLTINYFIFIVNFSTFISLRRLIIYIFKQFIRLSIFLSSSLLKSFKLLFIIQDQLQLILLKIYNIQTFIILDNNYNKQIIILLLS